MGEVLVSGMSHHGQTNEIPVTPSEAGPFSASVSKTDIALCHVEDTTGFAGGFFDTAAAPRPLAGSE
jgi:hypothetical protein